MILITTINRKAMTLALQLSKFILATLHGIDLQDNYGIDLQVKFHFSITVMALAFTISFKYLLNCTKKIEDHISKKEPENCRFEPPPLLNLKETMKALKI